MPRGQRPTPLPEQFAGPIAVRDALAIGVSLTRLRAEDLDDSVWGVRARARIIGTRARCEAFLARMPPGAFISHLTALELHEIALPRTSADRPIDIALPTPSRAPHAKGIAGHRLQISEQDLSTVKGLPVTTAGRAWADVARTIRLPDLVAIGDQLIQRPRGLVTAEELAARANAAPRHLGSGRMRRALELLDGASESYPESLLRVKIVLAGFASPRVNQTIRAGGRTFRPDLSYPQQRVILEYQGDYHRDQAQWRADRRRRLLLEAAGWTVIEVTWSEVMDPAPLFERLRALGITS